MERDRHHLSAVVFDYGCVLSKPQDSADIEAMAHTLNLDTVRFQEAYWQFRVAYDEAKLEPETYWKAVATFADRDLSASTLAELRRLDIQSWAHPNSAMVDWAKALRAAGLKTAVLSNMPADLRAYLVSPVSWLPEFDQVTFSCDIGSSKPAPAIYEYCLRGLGIDARAALFLDDREPNAQGGRGLGMHALVFTDAPAAATELREGYDLPALPAG